MDFVTGFPFSLRLSCTKRKGELFLKKETVIETFEEQKMSVAKYQLTSDLFAGKVFEDLEAAQELCRILMQNDRIILRSVRTQYVIQNLENHSVVLDIFAEEQQGNLIDIEIQMYREKAPFKRSRYYQSSIDMSILEKGKPYHTLPDVTIIYLTKEDFIGERKGFYNIDRKSGGQEVTMCLENGFHEKYYNLEYPVDDMRINELLHYFQHSEPFYKTENFPRIVERVSYLKTKKEGVALMCEITDRIRREGREEGRIIGKVEDILELLEELGKIPQWIAARIGQETDPEQLRKWHKCAAKASDMAEFEALFSRL